MKNSRRASGFRAVLCFLVTGALLTGLLVLSTLIPRETVAPRMQISADYLCEGELFGEAVKGVSSSRIDRYADSILLGIAWQYDGRNAFRSVMESAYYHLPYQNENENLRDAVQRDLPANQQYLRYWHGSAGIVRALMTFLTLPQIYLWHGILMGILFLSLLFRLLRRRYTVPAAALTAGLVGSAFWLVPLSLEYTWVFLLLLLQLHVILARRFPEDWSDRCLFFLVSGMLANYLDFLTCETLTVLPGLILLLWLDRKKGLPLPEWKTLGKVLAFWLAGYAGMYLLKWGLAALAMGKNVMPYVAEHIEERTVGSTGAGFAGTYLGAVLRNILNLFPMNFDTAGVLAGIALAVAAAYLGYVYHRNDFDRRAVMYWAVLGLVPYLRYLALANHSYLHAFFTFRAQLATLLAAGLILGEVTGWGESRGGSSLSRSRRGSEGRPGRRPSR